MSNNELNIGTVIEYLNRTKGYAINAEYYKKIDTWQDWWKGFYKPFHEYLEISGTSRKYRKLYTLKMAKKVCEDWAAILLNEKTTITINDKASSEFVQGEDGTGGVFKYNDFWQNANALVEKAFSSGTGAFVLKLSEMMAEGESIIKSDKTRIRIDYLPAMNIIPITRRFGKIIDAAFVSEVFEKGIKYIYLETHELKNGGYQITNQYFKYENQQLLEQPLPAGVAPSMNTGSDIPLFALLSPNIVNTFEKTNGLGMSVFANAIDNLMGVDLAFNNFCRDFKLGGKKVFYNETMVQTDENGKKIAPDDVGQQLFFAVGTGILSENGTNNMIQEFNPSLRVQDNKDGLQSLLDYLSFKCGLGTKHYQFNSGTIVTATQYTGDKQDLVQYANKHYIAVEKALQELVRAILWAGKEVLGLSVDPETQITVNFEDSFIIDKEAERMRDKEDARDSIMQKYEYRMKWYGEDEATAKKMIAGAQEKTDDEIMSFEG